MTFLKYKKKENVLYTDFKQRKKRNTIVIYYIFLGVIVVGVLLPIGLLLYV